jgi:acetyl-CoA carboxylase biotin carboxyl carrier protein
MHDDEMDREPMTESSKKPKVDADAVRALADLLQETGLTEIEYASGDWRVRVAKTPAPVAAHAHAAPAAPGPHDAAAPGAPADPDLDHPGLVTAPMVGVVYTAPEPGTPEFVKVGDRVATGDTLLLIEAMKVFNPIKAQHPGTVTRIFVRGGMPVEYGEPLIIVE